MRTRNRCTPTQGRTAWGMRWSIPGIVVEGNAGAVVPMKKLKHPMSNSSGTSEPTPFIGSKGSAPSVYALLYMLDFDAADVVA